MNRRGFFEGLLAAACCAAARSYPAHAAPSAVAPFVDWTAGPGDTETVVIRHGWLFDEYGDLVAEFPSSDPNDDAFRDGKPAKFQKMKLTAWSPPDESAELDQNGS